MEKNKVFRSYLTEAEERALFCTIKKYAGNEAERDLYSYKLLRNTGLRIAAFVRLSRGDARQALRTGKLHYISKGDKAGAIYCNRVARLALKKLLTIGEAMGCNKLDEQPLVISRQRNSKGQVQALSIRQHERALQKWCALADIPKATPHWLRHTCAKRLMKTSTSDNPIGVVMGVLNHSDPRSTHIYTMPDKEEIEDAMEGIA